MQTGRPKLIGVTGGIGSGKSTVCKIFEVLGNKIYYADDRAKWLMHNSEVLREEIVGLLGTEAYNEQGLNRSLISEKVFKDPSMLQQLNAIVHPAVGEDLAMWMQQHKEERLLFDEAALLFEIGSYKKMDATILVTAPEELRIKRVLKRDSHRSPTSVKEIIHQQMSDKDKAPLADFIIENDGSSSVIKQTMEIYDKLHQ